MQFLRRGGEQIILTREPVAIMLPPATEAQFAPFFKLGAKLDAFLRSNPNEILSFRHAVLHSCGNDFAGFEGQDRVFGAPNVGCVAIEHASCSPHGLEVAKNYHLFIAISRWNEQLLKNFDVGPVYLCHQGIDTSLFYPGPKSDRWQNRFVVFSGGKFEFRKGQDIVVAAFKRFRQKHPEALLVACWQNQQATDEAEFHHVGHCQGVPERADFGLQIAPWLMQQGLPPESFFDLPLTPNMHMPAVLRECDAALFPNRCEGGTNLVAMEAMACGVPTWVADNTGQKDLIDMLGAKALSRQRPVQFLSDGKTPRDWGESDLDEVVAALEYAYNHREKARKEAFDIAEKIKAWDWGMQNEKLLKIVCDGAPS